LTELELGVRMAVNDAVRAGRLRTLSAAKATYAALPVDEQIASAFAELVARARRDGLRPKIQDAWLEATAVADSVAVYTQDSDFDGLPGVSVVRI
jgi:predicted nucleic acid-binding protein